MAWWRSEPTRDSVILEIHAQPGAKRSEICGLHGDALKIRIAAPPRDGAANAALIVFLADLFAVPQRQVNIRRGQSGRRKTVEIDGSKVDPESLLP